MEHTKLSWSSAAFHWGLTHPHFSFYFCGWHMTKPIYAMGTCTVHYIVYVAYEIQMMFGDITVDKTIERPQKYFVTVPSSDLMTFCFFFIERKDWPLLSDNENVLDCRFLIARLKCTGQEYQQYRPWSLDTRWTNSIEKRKRNLPWPVRVRLNNNTEKEHIGAHTAYTRANIHVFALYRWVYVCVRDPCGEDTRFLNHLERDRCTILYIIQIRVFFINILHVYL